MTGAGIFGPQDSMLHEILLATVVLVHFGFMLFVPTGALLSWRWPRLAWAHLAASAWAAGSLTVGLPCPLTAIEKSLRRWSGATGYEGGFVDHYIEDVIYPQELSSVLRAVAVALMVAGYAGLLQRYAQLRGRRQAHVPA